MSSKTKTKDKNKRFKVFGPQEEYEVQFVINWDADVILNYGLGTSKP